MVLVFLIVQKHSSSFLAYIAPAASTDAGADLSSAVRHKKLMPVKHVYYLKIHKTGSTTVYSILAEYCRSHDLLALLPVETHINLKPPFSPSQIILDANVNKYDMVFNHHVYDEAIFTFLYNDTFKFTFIREPFKHFVSSFIYFKETENFHYLKQINTSNPIEAYLANPQKYDVKGYASYTNNRQSMDLGYNLTHTFNDTDYIQSFIAETEKHFDLILITDYFHESLILLKRSLRWCTQDILYYKKLARKAGGDIQNNFTELHREQHRRFSMADTELYSHFLSLFKDRLSKEVDIVGEVKEFEAVLKKVHTFCDKNEPTDTQLVVSAGRWSDEVDITHSKCKWLKLDEVSFTKHLKSVRKVLFSG